MTDMRKLLVAVAGVVGVAGALTEVLTWFGVTPNKIPYNSAYIGTVSFLNFGIPLYIVAILLVVCYFFAGVKTALSFIGEKDVAINISNIENIISKLSYEHRLILLSLLNTPNKLSYRPALRDRYKKELEKTDADFNILEFELEKLNLIRHGVHVISLTNLGSEVAKIIYERDADKGNR